MSRITVKLLEDMRACHYQVELFKAFLGQRAYVLPTKLNIRKASKFGLDIRWANSQSLIELTGLFEDSDGSKSWYINGQLHREGGPAREYSDGSKAWYVNGQSHREGGPAYEGSDGSKAWFINGRKLTETEFLARQASCDGKLIEMDGQTYRLELVK